MIKEPTKIIHHYLFIVILEAIYIKQNKQGVCHARDRVQPLYGGTFSLRDEELILKVINYTFPSSIANRGCIMVITNI